MHLDISVDSRSQIDDTTVSPDSAHSTLELHLRTTEEKVKHLQGPVLVLGASGFVGANLFKTILQYRDDVYGTTTRLPAWRLDGLPRNRIHVVDLLVDSNLDQLLTSVKPRTVLDCVAYGAYSFETDSDLIYLTNFTLCAKLLGRLEKAKISAYVHAGSSSEYGDNAAGPPESAFTAPNSHYAVSKAAAANLVYYYGKKCGVPCVNLRLYSVYGPLEDSSRLIPNVVRRGIDGGYPEFVNPHISRDFVYVDDACEAFLDSAIKLNPEFYGESFNVGSGRKTTIAQVASAAAGVFGIDSLPAFGMEARHWDLDDWYADTAKIEQRIGWRPRTDFGEGLRRIADWYSCLPSKTAYERASKRFALDTRHSVSAIVACYKDGQAIPIMYERLTKTLSELKVDYEIIFVNDCSPDDSEEVIRAITRNDRRVRGISHARNFGSQAAFRSGMAIAEKNSCVLLDGDLQDPPELIGDFVAKWREGYDAVYGRRIKREATLPMQIAYKTFYRLFDKFSYVRIPHDAGDFSLMDRRVVEAVLSFPERDFFLRGIRAYAGFRQTGVDYIRPERMFGVTTNSLWKNIGWAKKGILSFSYVPLNMLSVFGVTLCAATVILMLLQTVLRVIFPELAPRGITTVLLAILFFGSINLFAISLTGEYIAKVIEEVKRRPHFIRRSVIRDGEIRPAVLSANKDSDSG